MNPREKDLTAGKATWSLLFVLLLSTLEVQSLNAQRFTSYADPAPVAGQPFRSAVLNSTFTETSDNEDAAIPSGTILPVRLNATISSAKCKPGQIITAKVMQDVPLPKDAKIREGTKVIGHIVEVMAATATSPGRVSLKFDQLNS